jgi:hypothetical protein
MSKIFCITGSGNVEVNGTNKDFSPGSPIIITMGPSDISFNGSSFGLIFNLGDIIKNCMTTDIKIQYDGGPEITLGPSQYVSFTDSGFGSVQSSPQEVKKIKVCFTYETMQKLIPIINTEEYQVIKSKKGDTKIIRAEHKELGILEFTENHPFYYNSQVMNFDELVKVNPNFTSYKISNANPYYVYNVYKNTNNDLENYFKLSNDLVMLGARKDIHGIFGCFFNMKGELSTQLNGNKKILVR